MPPQQDQPHHGPSQESLLRHPPRTEGGHEVVDIGDMGTRVPIEDLQTPLLKKKEDEDDEDASFCWRVPEGWPGWLGKDDSHVSKATTAIIVSIANALVAFFFYVVLESALETFWTLVPEHVIGPLTGTLMWPKYVYLVATCSFMGLLVGCSLQYVGFPGDLPFIVYCVHYRGFIPIKYFVPMLLCSVLSIVGGGSLGPEAAIVLMCASVAGVIGQSLGHTGARLRMTTLCGMACGFGAFFGVPLGGPFFALEVSHRMGMEYYESTSYAVFSGLICCALYHVATFQPLGGIWSFPIGLGQPSTGGLAQGAVLGVVGAAAAVLFLKIHKNLGKVVDYFGIKKNQLFASTLAGFLLACLGLLVPQTLFWGEWEIQTILDHGATPLRHIWPKEQLLPYSLESPAANLLVPLVKLVAISITIHGGFRGGFIFPLFLSGAAIGSAIQMWFPAMDATIATMCVAASLNVAITRTPFGTALILACLSGQMTVLQPVVVSSLVSLMITNFDKFQLIKPQRARPWIEAPFEDEEYDHTAAE